MDRQVTAALAGSAAASAAVVEPAAELTTGPALAWRWVVHTDALDLYATHHATHDAARQDATEEDADARLTLIAGGGALHRAKISLAADGLAAQVLLLPDANPDHLAHLTPAGRIEVTDDALALFDATQNADDRPPDELTQPLVRELVHAAAAEGVRVRVREEPGQLIAVLYGEDTRQDWLRAGEALSAVRLEASRHGLTTRPSLVTDDLPAAVRDLPAPLAPYLSLRISAPAEGGEDS